MDTWFTARMIRTTTSHQCLFLCLFSLFRSPALFLSLLISRFTSDTRFSFQERQTFHPWIFITLRCRSYSRLFLCMPLGNDWYVISFCCLYTFSGHHPLETASEEVLKETETTLTRVIDNWPELIALWSVWIWQYNKCSRTFSLSVKNKAWLMFHRKMIKW